MDLELLGRTAVVIGGSSGIGAAAADVFGEEGCDVVLTFHQSRAGAEQAATHVRQHGRQAWVVHLDLMDPESVRLAAGAIFAHVGSVDAVVLCAGHNVVTHPSEITTQEWHDVLEVNLSGAFFALQALFPLVRSGGAIVTVASVAAHTGAPHHMHYAAAKAGLINLTKSLARELAPNIRVNCIAPGITLTPMGERTVERLPADYREVNLLLPRFATPKRIAQLIAVAASPVTEYMTGATIDVNSGRYLR